MTLTAPKAHPPVTDTFINRHIGPNPDDARAMLGLIGCASVDELIDQTVPADIRLKQLLDLDTPRGEHETLQRLKAIADKNTVKTSMIGMGYHGTITPAPILRNILENPLWYTAYTPYQAEISQGRLEALLNFQTMVSDLTALPLANASLLDEATAAAEAMAMCHAIARHKKPVFYVADACHPQTIAVVKTRAETMGIEVRLFDISSTKNAHGWQTVGFGDACGVLVQYPTTDGRIEDYAPLAERVHEAGALLVAACDILSLVLLKPPGEWGADIAIGSTQRFGVPMGFGGPHAAYMATHEKHARKMPGRIVGVSKDAHGNPAYRLAIQTREQHIKRDRATSNICTAQVLLAVIAGMYAVYHGPDGLKQNADSVHEKAVRLRNRLAAIGFYTTNSSFFDTVYIELDEQSYVISTSDGLAELAAASGINIRKLSTIEACITVDESTTDQDIEDLVTALTPLTKNEVSPVHPYDCATHDLPRRESPILTHPVFNQYHSEHEFLRYTTRLASKDITLANSMIPLGSCTMKLNAASEMLPITWPEFANIHPYAPADQAAGYAELFNDLENWLAEITGFSAVSLQPNAGSQGEYAGLLAIKRYHEARGDTQRDACLIPVSAHGTNPASAVIAGMRIVPVKCKDNGDIDVDDLCAKAEAHKDKLAALMVTYPSTHGVFETTIKEVCRIIHDHGGMVYMDGANMNAQVGLCRPGDIGADVCHLNLHKTFCIPHGGGGPGMGPIACNDALAPFLPGDPLTGSMPVSAAPFGSPSILPISWMYIAMMGADGLKQAAKAAILNANYMAERLRGHYGVLYTGANGRVAHEFIIDCRPFEKSAHVRVEDIAKRLMDYGFHSPTMSWPVAGTLMIEPTESESKAELDRLCDALIAIRDEIKKIETGELDRDDNPLKHAPHTAAAVSDDHWPHTYPRGLGAYPAPWLRDHKYWPPVGRVDNPYGDRHLVCTCPPMAEHAGA
jgi:glycine cleavage system P protein (glycine dehydrogenase)